MCCGSQRFCLDPDTDPTRGSDPDLDPIPDPSRSRSDLREPGSATLTSPTIQFFLSLFLLQNYKSRIFSDSTLRASATGATYAYSSRALRQPHRLGGQLQQVILKFFPFSKKNNFCSDPDTDTTRGMVRIWDPVPDPSRRVVFWGI